QLGDQEIDIIRMVTQITKYAVLVSDPSTIRYHLEKAYYLALSRRPGPCWLDLAVDVQSANIDPAAQPCYDTAEDEFSFDIGMLRRQCREVMERIRGAKRPVIMAGTGIRAAHALESFERVIRTLCIPVTMAWTHDLIASDDPLLCGRPPVPSASEPAISPCKMPTYFLCWDHGITSGKSVITGPLSHGKRSRFR